MNFLTEIFSKELISALGWTMLHSLWQGAAVAGLLGLTLIALKRRAAVIRYNLAFMSLLLIFVLSIITFANQYKLPAQTVNIESNPTELIERLKTSGIFVDPFTIEAAKEEGVIVSFAKYFEANLPLIVTAWFIGMLFLSLRFLGGIIFTERLKHYKVFPAAECWTKRINELALRLEIDNKINLLESALIEVPIMIGFFKPVVLFPLGALTGLPAEHIEAVLIHELAHIKRKDYLQNIFQKLIEVFMFYHPAVWWISTIVKNEREFCCDDYVINLTQNKINLAKALANLYGTRTEAGTALAFGKKQKLAGRIRRMTRQTKMRSTFTDATVLVIALLFALVSTTLYADNSKSEIIKTDSETELTKADHLFNLPGWGDKTFIFHKKIRGKVHEFKVETEDDEIVEIYMDDRKLDGDEFEEYKDRLKHTVRKIDREDDFDDDFAGRMENLGERIGNSLARVFGFEDDRHRSRVRISGLEALEELENLEIDIPEIDIDFDDDFEFDFHHDFNFDFDDDFEIDIDIPEISFGEDFHRGMENLKIDLSGLNESMRGLKKRMEKFQERMDDIKQEMIDDGLVEDGDYSTIKFKHGYMYIDGEKQSKEISEKYEKLFRKAGIEMDDSRNKVHFDFDD